MLAAQPEAIWWLDPARDNHHYLGLFHLPMLPKRILWKPHHCQAEVYVTHTGLAGSKATHAMGTECYCLMGTECSY